MKTRSKSKQELSRTNDDLVVPNGLFGSAAQPTLLPILRSGSEDELYHRIATIFEQSFDVRPKDLQVQAVVNLIKKRNTFLLAGTGYGKTRIAELLYKCFTSASNAIVLVLNPLDALGDNQVFKPKLRLFMVPNSFFVSCE